MDYGLLAYQKCVDLEERLAGSGRENRFLRVSRPHSPAAETLTSSDPLTLRGRGRADLLFWTRANTGSVGLYRDGILLRESSGEGTVALRIENEKESTLVLRAEGAAEIGCFGTGRVEFSCVDCLSLSEETVYLARGGQVVGLTPGTAWPAEAGRWDYGGFFQKSGPDFWLLKENGLYLSTGWTDPGILAVEGAEAFAAKGENLWVLRRGRLISARMSAGAPEVAGEELCAGSGLRVNVDGLLLERGEKSWVRKAAGGFAPYCAGVNAFRDGAALLYSRAGMLYRRENGVERIVCSGDEAFRWGGGLWVREGSNLFPL